MGKEPSAWPLAWYQCDCSKSSRRFEAAPLVEAGASQESAKLLLSSWTSLLSIASKTSKQHPGAVKWLGLSGCSEWSCIYLTRMWWVMCLATKQSMFLGSGWHYFFFCLLPNAYLFESTLTGPELPLVRCLMPYCSCSVPCSRRWFVFSFFLTCLFVCFTRKALPSASPPWWIYCFVLVFGTQVPKHHALNVRQHSCENQTWIKCVCVLSDLLWNTLLCIIVAQPFPLHSCALIVL